jgi:cytochrome P450
VTGGHTDQQAAAGSDAARPFDPAVARNPQPSYKLMRDLAPVVEMPEGQMRGVIVGKHDDVVEALRTPEVFSSGFDAVEIGQVRPLIPLQIDPPDHQRYRRLLDPLFAPRRIAPLEARARELVGGLIDAVVDRRGANFHAAVAELYPSTVFLELLGLPVSRASEFIELKDGIVRPPASTDDERKAIARATGEKIYALLEDVIDDRRDSPTDDIISRFLAAEIDGERLSRTDIVDICYLFFLAGLDTVTASLDCMLAFLAQNPDHRRQIVEDPALIPHAIEELLRWETPVPGVIRRTTAETEMSGCPIPADKQVVVLLGSANTDEAFWDRADQVDFHRGANKHLAFGGGIHRCLGSHLARLRAVRVPWSARPHRR